MNLAFPKIRGTFQDETVCEGWRQSRYVWNTWNGPPWSVRTWMMIYDEAGPQCSKTRRGKIILTKSSLRTNKFYRSLIHHPCQNINIAHSPTAKIRSLCKIESLLETTSSSGVHWMSFPKSLHITPSASWLDSQLDWVKVWGNFAWAKPDLSGRRSYLPQLTAPALPFKFLKPSTQSTIVT